MTPNLIRSVSAACLAAVLLPAQQEEEVVVELKPRVVKSKVSKHRSGAAISEIVERLADGDTSAKERKALKKKLLALIGDVKADALLEARPITKRITRAIRGAGGGADVRVKVIDQNGRPVTGKIDGAIAELKGAIDGMDDVIAIVEQDPKGKAKAKAKRKGKKKGQQRIVLEQPGKKGGLAYVLESSDGDNFAVVRGEAKKAMEQARKALAEANIEIGDLHGLAEVYDVAIDAPEIHIPEIEVGELKALLKSKGKGGHFVFDGSNLKNLIKGAKGKKNGFTFEVDGDGKGLKSLFGKATTIDGNVGEWFSDAHGAGKGKKSEHTFKFDSKDGDVQVWVEDGGNVRKITRTKKGSKGKGAGGIWSVQGPKGDGALLRLVERAKAHAHEQHEHEIHEHEEHEHEVHEHEEIFEEAEVEEEERGAEEMMEMIEEMRAEMRELREMMEEIRNSLRGDRSRTRGRRSNRRVGQVVPLSTREERLLPELARKVR